MKYENLDVLILTCNRAEYLKIQLDSIFQSSADWRETVIIDNASTDHTQDVVKQAMEKYPNRKVRVIRHEQNIGNAGNFKFSQSVSDNEYVAIFHDDDAIHPEYIDRAMYLLLENKNAVFCTGGAEALYNVNNENWSMLPDEYILYPQTRGGAFYQMLLGRADFMCCIYRTSAYRQVKYRPDLYGKLHDNIFLMEMNKLGDVIFQQGVVVRWRQHFQSDSNSLSTGPFPVEVLQLIGSIKRMLYKDKENFENVELYNNVSAALLYNFAYFLYKWSYLAKYLAWDDFRRKMIKERIFTKEDYAAFDKYMDTFYNPIIMQLAGKLREENRHQYYFHV